MNNENKGGNTSANRFGDDIGVGAVRADASEVAQCHVWCFLTIALLRR